MTVSLTTISSKLMQTMIRNRIRRHRDENGTTRKKSIFLQQIVMPHMSVLLFKKVSEHVDNSELFDTLYTEFPKEFD